MTKRNKPQVLIIDDEPDAGRATSDIIKSKVVPVYRSPSDVEEADLENANLVLVDFKLDYWPERDAQPTPSLKPKNGIALAACLRSNIGDGTTTPTAFALNSGRLFELSGSLVAQDREHAIARMIDLEWVFAESANSQDMAREIWALADAVRKLPHPWPQFQQSLSALTKLLNVNKSVVWHATMMEDVERACPPQDIAAETSKGLAIIRWLLHEVLPYPSFLLDERYLATRLYLAPSTLRKILRDRRRSAFYRDLFKLRYRGILHEFSGTRWWRAGVDHWLWRETSGRPLDKKEVQRFVRRQLPGVHLLDLDQPVVALDDQFRPTDASIERSTAVQIKPDDWPLTAEPARISAADASADPRIGSRVIQLDRSKLHLGVDHDRT
jgi:hypothetical protein